MRRGPSQERPQERGTRPQIDNPELAARDQRRQERLKRIAEASSVGRVRVVPTRDELRRVLRHPGTGVGFRETGGAEWPFDQFTKKRIREGDVTVEKRETTEPAATAAPGAGCPGGQQP